MVKLAGLILIFRTGRFHLYSINKSASRYHSRFTIERLYIDSKKLADFILAFRTDRCHLHSINSSISRFYPLTIIKNNHWREKTTELDSHIKEIDI